MQFHTIITHESPDLDAILCCYLLYNYGDKRYPGISNAKIQFCPAGCLPGGKNPEQLEQEGIIAVDIGGGRLDTHPQDNAISEKKLHLSAANLVAADLGIEEKNGLKNLLEFVRLQDSAGRSLCSHNPVDHLVSLPNLVRGGALHFGSDFHKMVRFFMDVFYSIETADQASQNDILRQDPGYLIAIQDDQILLPSSLNLKTLFAAYLGNKYLGKTIPTTDQVSNLNSQEWDNLHEFLKFSGVLNYVELKKIIAFIEELKPGCYLLNSSNPLDQTVSMPNIINGIYLRYRDNLAPILEATFSLFDCAIAYEKSWEDAVNDYILNRELHQIGNIKLVAIRSQHGAVVKVARWKDRADIIILQDPHALHVSISINRSGRLKNYSLRRLASRLRAAELMVSGNENADISSEQLLHIGEFGGWFLHQSEKLLLHGSPKARREPSAISLSKILQLTIGEFDKHHKIPDALCPGDRCLHHECLFYPLRLNNCFTHRNNLRSYSNALSRRNSHGPS